MTRWLRQPRDDEGHFIVTGPTVASAFVWAGVAGGLALAIVLALGVMMTALHRARVDACLHGGANAVTEFSSSPAERGQALASGRPRAASDGCSAGDPASFADPSRTALDDGSAGGPPR